MQVYYLEANEYEEEAVIKKPDNGPQSSWQSSIDTIAMVVNGSDVKTAGKVECQRSTEQ